MFYYSFKSVFLFLFLCLTHCLFSNTLEDKAKLDNGIGEGISSASALAKGAQAKVKEIDAAFEKIKSSNAFKTIVDGYELDFPYGVLPTGGNDEYALAINNIGIDPNVGSYAEVFMKIPKGEGEYLYFIADKVPLSGGTMSGEMKLYLLKTTSSKVGDGYNLIFNGLDVPESCSYASVDCKGFKELEINGSLTLNPKAVKSFDTKDSVNMSFHINADRLANMVIGFHDVPVLEFKSLPGFKCEIPHLTLDKSALRNDPDFSLPQWYLDSIAVQQGADFNASVYRSSLWEGVYAPKINITIPRNLSEGSAESEVVVQSSDFIVDENGITSLTRVVGQGGMASNGGASPVFSGDLGGFKYAVDSLRLNIIASSLSKAGIYGEMSFPICDEESKVGYGVTITKSIQAGSELEYYGYANTTLNNRLNASAFGVAQLTIKEGTQVNIEYKDKKLFPKVILAGELTVAPKKKGESKTAGKISLEFDGFAVSSRAPYVAFEGNGGVKVNLPKNSKLAKLPVSINSGNILTQDGGQRMGLNLNLTVKLQKSSGNSKDAGNGFGGTADFVVWAKRNAGTKRWGYDDFTLNSIAIDVKQGAFEMKGDLSMFTKDTVYGKGFCGFLNVKIIDKIDIKASTIFGKTQSKTLPTQSIEEIIKSGGEIQEETEDVSLYRYWFVDAEATFSPGIPFFPGIQINSFTGGLYHNMVMVTAAERAARAAAGNPMLESTVKCKTATGREFVPEKHVFGLIAGIGVIDQGGGEAFNGKLNFGLEFYTNGGGLKRIATWGGVSFVNSSYTAPSLASMREEVDTKEGDKKSGQEQKGASDTPGGKFAANWYVEYDFDNKKLVGDFDLYVNAGFIEGANAGGKAGRISFMSSPSDWYVYFGLPSNGNRIALRVLNVATTESYLCMGSVLPNPAIAPMPPGFGDLSSMDYGLLAQGGGFSFGTRFISGSRIEKGISFCSAKAYLRYSLEVGFDIMLSKSTKKIVCNDKVRGINGWYATGQAFFYGEAGVGVSYDCALGSRDKELLTIFIRAGVFAQFPNPTYIKGYAEAGIKFLKKKYSKRFEVEVGSQCLGNSETRDVYFVEGIEPDHELTDVSVSTPVTIFFKEKIHEFTYNITNESNRGQTTFRGHVDGNLIKIFDKDFKEISSEFELNENMQQAVLTPRSVLPSNDTVYVIVKVVTEKQNGTTWEATSTIEIDTFLFVTRAEPAQIVSQDVYYAYPIPGMTNFYKDVTDEGFVQFATLPNNPVKLHPDYEYVVAFYEGNNELDRTNRVTYNPNYGEHNFDFKIPIARLKVNKNYTFKILKAPKETNTSTTSTIEGIVKIGEVDNNYKDSVILSYDFKTSKYKTFDEKISIFNSSVTEAVQGSVSLNLEDLARSSEYESLTMTEVKGYIREGIIVSNPLIQFGEINYHNERFSEMANTLGNESSFSLNNSPNENLEIITTVFDDVNQVMEQLNMDCLLNGGCDGENITPITINKGKIVLPIGYYLPGGSSPISTYDLIMDLDKNLVLPF